VWHIAYQDGRQTQTKEHDMVTWWGTHVEPGGEPWDAEIDTPEAVVDEEIAGLALDPRCRDALIEMATAYRDSQRDW
jgi:hypothetical protein